MYTNAQRWDVSDEEYRASDRMGSTDLKTVLGFGYDKPIGKEAADFGTALHYAALEPEKLDQVTIKPVFTGKGAVAARKEWEAENEGKICLPAASFELVMQMLEAFQKHPIGKVLRHQDSVFEQPIICEDPETGVLLKSKPDITLRHTVFNLKSASDASESEFERSGGGRLWRMGYAQAGAHERDAYAALTGEDVVYALIVVEKRRPARIAVYEVTDHPDDLDRGWMLYGRRMNRAALTIEAARRARGDEHYPRWWDREPMNLCDPLPFVAAEVGKFEKLAAKYAKGVL